MDGTHASESDITAATLNEVSKTKWSPGALLFKTKLMPPPTYKLKVGDNKFSVNG